MNGWSVVARKRTFLLGALYLAAVMIAPHEALGQSSTAILEGTVRSQPGAPVAGAEATGQGVRAVTDAQGRFRLEVVAGTPVLLTVGARGYSPARLSVAPPMNRMATRCPIRLCN